MSQSDPNKRIVFEDDLTTLDPARRAEAVLTHVLDEERGSGKPKEEVIGVDEARKSRTVIDRDTNRTMSRALFVTADQSVLLVNSNSRNSYLALAGVFDEIHVMVVVDRQGKNTIERLSDNVWVYSVYAKHWWLLPFHARSEAEEALVFNGAVRPDVIVGTDPYVAGLSAYWIAGSFARPVQIQVHEDFTADVFKQKPRGKWYARIAKYVLKRVNSVRVSTDAVEELIKKRFTKIVDLRPMPHFYNISGLKNSVPSFDVHEKYQDFVFIMLAYAPITADSYLHNIFSALRSTLLNPRIGLVVVGTGPAKELYREKVKLLGIEKNVVFLPRLEDEVSFFKSADLLVEMSIGKESEERVLRAAASGLPILAAETDIRKNLFKDGESAFLCPADDVYCFGQKTNKFLNQGSLRVQFSKLASEIVEMRVNEDPTDYYRALRDSIEVIIETVEETTEEIDDSGATNQDPQPPTENEDNPESRNSGQTSTLGV